jgi:hypothetical protein
MPTTKLSERIRKERTDYDNLMMWQEEDRRNREREAKLAGEERTRRLNKRIIIIISSIVGPFILAGLIAVGNGHSFESGVTALLNVIVWILIVAVILIVIALFSK